MISVLNVIITDKDDQGYYERWTIPCRGETITTVYKMLKNFIKKEARDYFTFNRIETVEEDVKTTIVNPSNIKEAIFAIAVTYPDLLSEINTMNEYYTMIEEEKKRC